MLERPDTIVARASGAGRAGVAVFRLSGPDAFRIAKALCGRLPAVRQAMLRKISDENGAPVDEGLVLLFEGPESFTGEDVAELHLHGGRAVEAAFLQAATALGARPAAPGEFTKRALLSGRMDLAQVEALADLLDAETSLQRMQALGQLGGRLSVLAQGWKQRLVAVLAPLEAEIDFPDEEGVPASIASASGPAIDALLGELQSYLSDAVRARTIREGVSVAIVGAPNAGKSSLLNRLAGSEVAIVSDQPGTTRDVLEVRLDLGGLAVLLADTAGLREGAADPVEAEGMKRALARATDADIRILVVDSGEGRFQPADAKAPLTDGDFVVFNKSDLAGMAQPPASDLRSGNLELSAHTLSAKTGDGVDAFIRALTITVRNRYSPTQDTALTRLRHAEAVQKAATALERARRSIASVPELAAEDARLAARALGEITGEVGIEDVLDEIFSSFCIGK